jgi:hypothetical protein
MASKVILDAPNLLTEDLIPVASVPEHLPVSCSPETVQRWLRGNCGIVLESVSIGGRRFCSIQGIERFLRGQLGQVEPAKVAPKQSGRSRKDVEAAARRFGLPEPLSRKQEGDL